MRGKQVEILLRQAWTLTRLDEEVVVNTGECQTSRSGEVLFEDIKQARERSVLVVESNTHQSHHRETKQNAGGVSRLGPALPMQAPIATGVSFSICKRRGPES